MVNLMVHLIEFADIRPINMVLIWMGVLKYFYRLIEFDRLIVTTQYGFYIDGCF